MDASAQEEACTWIWFATHKTRWKIMTERQEKFVEYYSLTGNAAKSAVEAGYSQKTAKQKGYELKKLLSNEIHEQTQKILQDKIPASIHWLTELAQTAESESVRLGAIKDLLDRAGLKPVERIEQTNVERMSDEEIQRELNALIKH
jgi:phage terminase small subunit